jgi:hypothetical protein
MFDKNDILLFTESWLNDHINFQMTNFSTIHLHRTEKRANSRRDSGKLIIYIRIKFTCMSVI